MKQKFESWWESEAHHLHELTWCVGYPVQRKDILYLHTRGKEIYISRKGMEPYWVGLAEQAWAMNRGLA